MAVSVVAVVVGTVVPARVDSTVALDVSSRMALGRRVLHGRMLRLQRKTPTPTHSTALRVKRAGAIICAGQHDPWTTHVGAGYIAC